MPYKTIVYIKLFVEILEDPRWLYQCNERQQLLYIKMLLLAGRTQNKVPKDLKFLKQKTNYGGKYPTLSSDIRHLLATFPKFLESPNCYYFKNFRKHIPYLSRFARELQGSSFGTPKEVIDEMIGEYIRLKGWEVPTNSPLMTDIYKRNTNVVKKMMEIIGNKATALRVLKWTYEICRNKGLDWTLETVIKKYPEWLTKYGKEEDRTPKKLKGLVDKVVKTM